MLLPFLALYFIYALTPRAPLKLVVFPLFVALAFQPAFAATVTLTLSSTNPATATWSSSPAASSCTASGGAWNGTKASSGAEQLPAVTATTTYTLTCTWPADDKATLSWSAPASNTDGSMPANVGGYNVYQDDSSVPSVATAKKIVGSAPNTIPATQLQYVVTGLSAGLHSWAVQAWYCAADGTCVESDLSAFATKTNTAATTANASATQKVAVAPKMPLNLRVL